MEALVWNSLIFISQLMFTVCFALLTGQIYLRTALSHVALGLIEFSKKQYILACMAMGGLSSICWFLANTGGLAESGFMGMFDPTMFSMMADSSIGKVTISRIVILIAIVVVVWSSTYIPNSKLNRQFGSCICAVLIFLLAWSYTVAGHMSSASLTLRSLVSVHLIIMAWWFGLLLPLYFSSLRLTNDELYKVMHRFGIHASFLVPMLLLAGLTIAYSKFSSISQLITSDYGVVLLVKVTSVSIILAIAANHKLRLVPNLKKKRTTLQMSLRVEIVVALCILIITTGLSSFVSPPM
ncbi:hypothetical protein C2869_16235 [Saccharobesus litoralis]|uniref:Copper resistance protein D n=1 Tax=Saccharobesus litoralis TaxID=2172099 RepID=A0A2S0VUH6_9ALTE|nr:CopD family protein [Saccharobesus litoralis]AWB67876.1 hypothetical protein C2869_16235 [Saccharobesus litoralis]